MIRGLKVSSAKRAATGMDGGHTYVSGITIWNGDEVPVFVFLKNPDEEKRIDDALITGPLVFDALRYDFVIGHGLSLFDAEQK